MVSNNERMYDFSITSGTSRDCVYAAKSGYYLEIRGNKNSGISCREAIFLPCKDLVCLAKAVKTMTDKRICFNAKVARKYLSGIKYDSKAAEKEFRDEYCKYTIKVEVKYGDVYTDVKYNKLYRVTFIYVNAFGDMDEVQYTFREKDFIALGKTACAALEAENEITMPKMNVV